MGDRQHRSRNKSRRHRSRDRSRSRNCSRSRSRTYYSNRTRSRSRARSRSNSYGDGPTTQQTLQLILSRLNTLETERSNLRDVTNHQVAQTSASMRSHTPPISELQDNQALQARVPVSETLLSSSTTALNIPTTDSIATERSSVNVKNHSENSMADSARILADAIKSVNSDKSQKYFVSNFDPTIHDIEVWCEEVERARVSNNWGDSECLSRVSICLKGDARTWLNEWVTSDRTWSNFVKEFKPLCPRKLDYANILYDAMQATSDRYSTYAEYARRTLLRLKIVKGLSDELRTLIVIRGITDAQVRAAAANANLQMYDLVSFLSIYAKPTRAKLENRKHSKPPPNTRVLQLKCFVCGQHGHKSHHCPKKPKVDQPSNASTNNTNKSICNFCKKPGHSEDVCFAKERSGSRNNRNINLCKAPITESSQNSDLKTAIIQGIPVDVLIDSGALNISLVSSDVLKYFSCERKPRHFILKGISNSTIQVHSYVTLTIEFDEISIEADFVVVPGSCMTIPVVIGTDILNRDGITYVRTKDRQYLTHTVDGVVHAVSNDDLQINTPLQGVELNCLKNLIKQFSKYFISGTASTTVTTGKMSIKLTDDTPVAYRPYKLSHTEKLKVREIVRDLKDKGIIRDSCSEYASPIILVKKKDGSDRMCVDYRALNRLTVRDRYPLPLIDDHIDRLGNFKYFSSLDMATGFHQIVLEDDSIHKTAFVTPEGHFEYLRMPYGLTNSPIVYQRIINDTLRGHIEAGNVLVYVDDVLCMSNSIDEGVNLLKTVLDTLTTSGFSINLRKCSFLSTEIEYLGRVISQGQVKPSPRKIQALVDAPPPRNVKQVRQFLGLAGYFRRYIKDYATKTACIARLMKKDTDFSWGPEQEKVRQEIINCLTQSPILSIFDQTLATEVHTDASSIGYGAVLMQKRADGTKHVVAYYSKATQGAESKYHSYELETLAVVRALQNFRHYLVGINFKVITDCNALKATEKKKDLLPRVARWWIYLQDFNFTIDYRKGTMMTHADYLSRNPVLDTRVHQISRPRNWAQIAQSADNETQSLLQKLQDGELDPQRYVRQNDLLYYRYTPIGEESRLLCFIPKGHRLSLLRIFHDEHEHVCAEKTLDLILKYFWFPGLRQFVTKYIKHCLVCVSNKRVPRAPHQPITSWEKPTLPFETLHIDALGPLPESDGYKFVLLIVDSFTKYCLLYPIYRQDVNELKRTFTNTISLFGVPKLVVADRGRMFESSEFSTLLSELGCDIHLITPEMHNANGQVERYVRTVLNMIRIETNHRHSKWSEQLWKLQLVLNITKQKTTQTSPLKLLVGTDGSIPVVRTLIRDVAIEMSQNHEGRRELDRMRAHQLLSRNQAKQDAYVNRQRQAPRIFKLNDLVFVIKYSQSTGKLDPGIRGPYRVIKVLPSNRYQLKLISGSYGKTTQAAAEYMVPWNGEWCPESCAAFFEDDEVCDPGAGPSSVTLQPRAETAGGSGEPSTAEMTPAQDGHHEDCAEDGALSG